MAQVPYISDNESLSPTDIATQVCDGLRPTLSPDFPPGLAALVCRCWHQDPTARPMAQKASELTRSPDLYDPQPAAYTSMTDVFDAVMNEYWLWHSDAKKKLETSILQAHAGTLTLTQNFMATSENMNCFVSALRRQLHDFDALKLLLQMLIVLANSCSDEAVQKLCSAGVVQRISDVLILHQSRLELLLLGCTCLQAIVSRTPDIPASTDVTCVVSSSLMNFPQCVELLELGTTIVLQLFNEETIRDALVEAGLVDTAIRTMVEHPNNTGLLGQCEQILRILAANQGMMISACDKSHLLTEHAELIRRKCSGNAVLESFCLTLPEPHDSSVEPLPEVVYNVILLGISCVGKTSIFRRFFSEGFSETTGSTYGVSQVR